MQLALDTDIDELDEEVSIHTITNSSITLWISINQSFKAVTYFFPTTQYMNSDVLMHQSVYRFYPEERIEQIDKPSSNRETLMSKSYLFEKYVMNRMPWSNFALEHIKTKDSEFIFLIGGVDSNDKMLS